MSEIPYVGNELVLFEKATVWKKYFGHFLTPYLKGDVLEVGAGIGGTTNILCNGSQDKWVCLEPDPDLFANLQNKIRDNRLPSCCSCIKGTTGDLKRDKQFNAILYIDVIEHIENDVKELTNTIGLLSASGYLIVLVPAHPFLYNRFDKAIGHYRRYNKKMLAEIAPAGFQLVEMRYLDSCGLVSSLVNKYFLKQDSPTETQISFWDKILVPLSKVFDFISNYSVGKSLVAVWQKKNDL